MYKNFTINPGIPDGYIRKILLVMRLTTVLLIVTIMQVSANSFAQKITYVKKNATLEMVFKEIMKQTDYNVLWYAEKLKDANTVDVDFRNTTIEKVLEKVMEDQPFSYTIKGKTVVIKGKEPSVLKRVSDGISGLFNDITVSGKVVGENGKGLPGATVKLKGDSMNIAVVTSSNGNFSLRVPVREAVLIVSYVGYKTKEVSVSGITTDLVISMDPIAGQLEGVNVVSTGYQTLPKERATGSFEKINNQLFNRTTTTDVISRLNGTVPGLLFNNKAAGPKTLATLTIRGLSSLSVIGPLIVLDNIAYEGDVNNINPNDIESITVLKDAAAASIWGTRAGNGVIVITTKKGRYDKPINISLNANLTVSEKPDLKYISQISSSDFIDVEKFLFNNKFYDSKLTTISPFRPFLTPVIELLAKQRALPSTDIQGKALIDTQIDVFRQYDVRNDYEKYIYRNQFNQQYALNISGGGKQSNYFISGGFDKNMNNTVNSGLSRITIRSEYNFRPLKKLEIQTGIIFSQNKTNSIPLNSSVGYRTGVMAAIYPYARFTDDEENPAITGITYGIDYLNNLSNNANLLDWRYKILDDINKSNSTTKVEDIQFNLGTTYNVNSILSADIKYQYRTANSYSEDIYNQGSYNVRDLVNRYTAPANYIDPVTKLPAPYKMAIPTGGIYIPSHIRSNSQTLRGQLNANKNWGNLHQLAAIAGVEIRKNYSTGNNEGTRYGYDPQTKTFKTVDYLNPNLPLFYGGSAQIPYGASYGDNTDRSTSLFTNASYTYNNRYVLSASARKDASNVFGTRSNKKGAPLWSTGLSWNLSNESFYKFELIPYLKLRATYGYSGNTIPGVPAFALASRGINSTTQLPFASSQNLPNPDLRWEKVGMLNFGLDFNSKNNRFSGSIEYFRKKSTDVIASAPVDATTGYDTQRFNTANLKGKGIDLTLHSINLKTRIFEWNSDFIFSYNRNKVSKYLLSTSSSLTYVGAAGQINPIEGKDAYAIFAFRWAGLDPLTGDPQGYINGQISKNYTSLLSAPIADLKYYGSSIPIYYGALRNNFTIGRITLSANILYKLGYYFKRQGLSYSSLYSANTGLAEFANRWQKPGDETITNIPSMIYPANANRDSFYNNSDAVVDKGDHIRLQDITAAFTFNKIKGLKNCKLYVNVINLGIIWKANKDGIDPDIQSGYKSPRTITFGLNTNF